MLIYFLYSAWLPFILGRISACCCSPQCTANIIIWIQGSWKLFHCLQNWIKDLLQFEHWGSKTKAGTTVSLWFTDTECSHSCPRTPDAASPPCLPALRLVLFLLLLHCKRLSWQQVLNMLWKLLGMLLIFFSRHAMLISLKIYYWEYQMALLNMLSRIYKIHAWSKSPAVNLNHHIIKYLLWQKQRWSGKYSTWLQMVYWYSAEVSQNAFQVYTKGLT